MNCKRSCFNSFSGRTGDILLESQNANGSFWLEENIVSISPIRRGHQVPQHTEGLLANLWLLRWEQRSRLRKHSPALQSCCGVSQKEPPPRLQLSMCCSRAAKGLPLRIKKEGVFHISFQLLPSQRGSAVPVFYDMDAHPLRREPRSPNSFCRDHQTAIWDQLACHYSSPSDLNCWPTSESPCICLPAMCRPIQLSNEKSFLPKQSRGGRALAVHRLLQLAWSQGPSWAQCDGEVGVSGVSGSVTTGCWLEQNGSH